jgi:hypothetical protein
MAISSIGYEGTVNYADWAILTSHLGARYSVFALPSFEVSAGPGEREVLIAPGQAAGQGIYDSSDAVESLTGAAVTAGDRWDLVALRRNWTTSTTSPVLVPGGSMKILPNRTVGPGNVDDQPIAMVRFSAGQSAVQEIVDLRCWHGDGGMLAKDLLARSYLTRLGTRVWINGVTWVFGFGVTGNPAWVTDSAYVGSTAPAYADNLVWIKKP